MTASNTYCEALGISVPSLAAVHGHREANTYALLIVTLLEHGHPMTLAEVALKFEAAGVVSHVDDAYFSLKRCRPARPPVYRDGDLYALDPHDHELDMWAFRLGLRPPRVPRREPPPPRPRPPVTQRLSVEELDEAWRNDANLMSWSAQRIALAILDAHDRPMDAADVVAFVSVRTKWHRLAAGPTTFRRSGAVVAVAADGTWSIVSGAAELVVARNSVRDAIERTRRWPVRSTAEEMKASSEAYERRRRAHAAELAALRRVIVHAFPARSPRAVVLVDVDRRELMTLIGDELSQVGSLLQRFDVLSGVDIRTTLRELGVDPKERRLAELGPPQKSVGLSTGRSLKITTAMLIQGSCGISRPLGNEKQLRSYLARDQHTKLRSRLEADAKALYALHEYGRTHGGVRVRWGSRDQMFPVPWHHHDEPTLYHLLREAFALSMGVVGVVGAAPPWDDPWSRAERLEVVRGEWEHHLMLFDELGRYVDDRDVQIARLEANVN